MLVNLRVDESTHHQGFWIGTEVADIDGGINVIFS